MKGSAEKYWSILKKKRAEKEATQKRLKLQQAVESKQQDKRKSMESARATHDKFVQRQKRMANLEEIYQAVKKKRKH